jgi:outer membrane protein assembly factor BamB
VLLKFAKTAAQSLPRQKKAVRALAFQPAQCGLLTARCLAALGLLPYFVASPARAEFGDLLFQLSASDAFGGDEFGRTVDISGTKAIIGSLVFGPHLGTRRVYVFDLTTGQELRNLTASIDISSSQVFGNSVSLDGNLAVIGAPGILSNPGAAYVFDVTSGRELHYLTDSDTEGAFGFSVAISGNKAIIGDVGDAAYVFDATTGQEQLKLTPTEMAPGDAFGRSVAISSNLALVGAPAGGPPSDPGAAYVFDLTTGDQLFKLTASDSKPDDWFGNSVAINGNIGVVGAPRVDPGAAYVFDLTTGQELFKLSPSNVTNSSFYFWVFRRICG